MYYNLVIRTSAGNELLYEDDGDKLMRDLKIAINSPNHTGTVLVEDEKMPIRKEVFEELSRIRSLFKQNENITGFEIYDSFQHSKEKKFSVEFLENGIIEVTKIEEEEENEL